MSLRRQGDGVLSIDGNWLVRYGIGRQSGNKHAEEAANLNWKGAKESLKAQEGSIRLAGGGLRRFSGDKPHGQEVFTNTLDLRSKPVRHLYSRLEEHGDKAYAQEDGRRRFREHGSEDVWKRLSKPIAFSTRMNKSGESLQHSLPGEHAES